MSTQSRLGRGAAGRLQALLLAQRFRCFYCDALLSVRRPGASAASSDATIDHFFPRSFGGQDNWRNWVLACRPCNNTKASRQPTEAEMLRWNALALEWRHIEPIDLTLRHTKRCTACQGWIDPMRLESARCAGTETETCRPQCHKKLREQRHQAVQQVGVVRLASRQSRPWSWSEKSWPAKLWQRLLRRLRHDPRADVPS